MDWPFTFVPWPRLMATQRRSWGCMGTTLRQRFASTEVV